MSNWHQNPPPGTRRILHSGDILTLTLFSNSTREGTAWLRTNLGHAEQHRHEIIKHVEEHAPILARDWHDLPMQATATPGVFEISMPTFETGRFEAKAFFLPNGDDTPIWPDGENLVIKVEPADTFCANSIYTAFVRQFGPNMRKRQALPIAAETLDKLDEQGYTLIPKSGTFRALNAQLDHIITELGFRIIQLLPIHPVPTTFARMGRFGSPFASIDFFDVDPALAEFDRKSTPLDQFTELADGIHQRRASLFLDLPINHTGWASHLQLHHPEWFARNGDQTFSSPGAWGITWEDLSELDYKHRGLWKYMAEVFLFWCEKGVDGFRCDAGYMVPLPVWEYIVAKVRQSYPDTVFLLEGLGGKISVMRELLDRANLNWAYSELFQVYDRGHLEHEIQNYHSISNSSGTLIHFAETHDNNRLAAASRPYARMRTALAALCSENGAFGITNGLEWFAETKIDVHGAPPLNWDSDENQNAELSALNHLLKTHPAFQPGSRLRILPGYGSVLHLLREPARHESSVLVLVNLDTENPADANWSQSAFDLPKRKVIDLISGIEHSITDSDGDMVSITLAPGGVICLGQSASGPLAAAQEQEPPAIAHQRLRAAALSLHAQLASQSLQPDQDADLMATALANDPMAFCESLSGHSALRDVTTWQWPEDLHRTVMLPAGHHLLLQSPFPFRAILDTTQTGKDHCISVKSLPRSENMGYFALLPTTNESSGMANLVLSVFTPDGVLHQQATISQLGASMPATLSTHHDRETLRDSRCCALLTNAAGAMSQPRLEWGRILSKYDCILAANLNDRVPVDRHVLFTRCRAWLLYKGYSYSISIDCTDHAEVITGKSVKWHFEIPAGMGKSVPIVFTLQLHHHCNRVHLEIERPVVMDNADYLSDDIPIVLILRPDIEDRNFHEVCKAYSGPEYVWPGAIHPFDNGFRFVTGNHPALQMDLIGGSFAHETEWLYGIPHPVEAERGLEPNSDLFSPGYFSIELSGGGSTCLQAFIEDEPRPSEIANTKNSNAQHAPERALDDILKSAIRDFIVRRDDSLTVIAGYPWFLDWGRDTLICLRGIIAADMLDEARDILLQFARFEDHGTLPNMIRGNDDRNRDTSDAPLWFFTACNDWMQAAGDKKQFLASDCNGRPLIDVLRSLATNMISGTPNGIVMDAKSGLIFSPSHFTWMDTNYPAGTPREGYPIEIQALWHAALRMLSKVDKDPQWKMLANQVQASIARLFPLPDRGYLSDCLHAKPGTPAVSATPDNALRPNQLFAITLGAIIEPMQVRGILNACSKLLIPGAIRSLADHDVSPPLAIHGPHGLLNNPNHPYVGSYSGDEDTQRKPAYHNGTAWTWPFPSYCEALAMHDPDLHPTAVSLLSSIETLIQQGCVGHLPEILDGNFPHKQRGCLAQAWGATEAYRVLKLLNRN